MIVEDEPLERIGLRKIIQRDCHNIELLEDSKNGIEAIDNAKKYRPDIILMDIRMPEMTGLEAQQRIYQSLPLTKTIILTAYSDFNYAQEAIKHGVHDYLLKPIRPVDLKKAVNSAINAIDKTKVSSSAQPPHQSGHSILKSVIRYIENHYSEDIKLNDVAEYVHLNPQYFSRYFKKEMGVNFTEYVTKLRIEKAKSYLLKTDKPIYRIAVDLGFNDASYFCKVFLKYENQTPVEYKKKWKALF